ncbi:MAG: hypothetical protein Q7S66_00325 [bacterium]|nr:hypothetical protein [bacterium]
MLMWGHGSWERRDLLTIGTTVAFVLAAISLGAVIYCGSAAFLSPVLLSAVGACMVAQSALISNFNIAFVRTVPFAVLFAVILCWQKASWKVTLFFYSAEAAVLFFTVAYTLRATA